MWSNVKDAYLDKGLVPLSQHQTLDHLAGVITDVGDLSLHAILRKPANMEYFGRLSPSTHTLVGVPRFKRNIHHIHDYGTHRILYYIYVYEGENRA